MIRRIVCIAVILILSFAITGCGKSPDFLTANDWVFCSGCNETIHFGDNGEFSYYEACGNPVGNYDLYDKYSYDDKTREIKLLPDGETLRVIRHDENRILIDFGDGVKEFFNADDPRLICVSPEAEYDFDNLTEGFSSYLMIIEKKGDVFVTAPAGYDGDNPEYDSLLLECRAEPEVSYSQWLLEIDSGEPESSFGVLDEKEAREIINLGSAAAYVWYSPDGKISKVMFHGSTEYY